VKISTEQLEKVKALEGQVTPPENVVETAVIKLMNGELIKSVAAEVNSMPDRDDMVADLKARIERGEYKVSSEEIVDTMVRRARADRIS
jgi:anti-sigma28 factor (negative regulator of flagellin synthesis)